LLSVTKTAYPNFRTVGKGNHTFVSKVFVTAFSDSVIKPGEQSFTQYRRTSVLCPVTANQVAASGIQQSTKDNRHYQYGCLA
jgi:hypothetical protein